MEKEAPPSQKQKSPEDVTVSFIVSHHRREGDKMKQIYCPNEGRINCLPYYTEHKSKKPFKSWEGSRAQPPLLLPPLSLSQKKLVSAEEGNITQTTLQK